MRFPALSRLLPILLAVFLAASSANAASVIVELNQDPAAIAVTRARAAGRPMSDAQVEAYRATLSAAQDQFLAKLRNAGIAFQLGGVTLRNVRVDYRYTLVFNGVNLIVDPTSVERIASMPEVKKVHNDDLLHTTLDVSVPYVRAQEVYGSVKELTRYDQFREGYEGQGIYVSIIDTGVEWQHEMFGGDPTPPRIGVEPAVSGRNEKVVYYLPLADLVGEDGVGHGTHVASTAAGYLGFAPGADGIPTTADDLRMHGVAPQARVMAYNVCSAALSNVGSLTGAVGGCLSSSITMAIEDSVSPRTVNGFPKPVAHVINMSLGGAGTPDSVNALAADNAVRLGAVVVAAAGNSGPGEFTAGAPCVGRFVTCVANSIDPAGSWSVDVLAPTSVNRLLPGAVSPAAQLPASSTHRQGVQVNPMTGSPDPPSKSIAQYYVFVSGGETPGSYPANVAGRIALVLPTLTATFAQVANSAAAAGAIAIIEGTNVANPTAVKTTIPAAVINMTDFNYLRSIMGAGANPPSGTLSSHPLRLNPFFGATTMSASSSRGPVAGFGQVKPDVSGPGTNIMAAMPPASLLGVLAQGNYGAISGTSMASPHVAGAAALIKQAHPAWTADMIRTALLNTSTNLRNERGQAKPDSTTAESVIDQGGGLIDVFEAVNAKALMGVTGDGLSAPTLIGSHSFGEVPSIDGRAVVTRTVRVTIQDVSGTAGVYNLAIANNRGLEIAGISVTTPSSVSVPANGAATFDVVARIDGSIVKSGDPLQLQWYVRASRADGAESISMPFYLRATRTVPPAATMLPVADDATPDRSEGIDRDGRYVVAWTWPGGEVASPCAFRIEEARPAATGTIWYDDAEEVMVTGNAKWVASNWTTRPHPGTLSLGYGAVYIDKTSSTLTMATDLQLPPSLVTLTFDSFEDAELDFDYTHVDVSTDGGTSWTNLTRWTGAFSGERHVDLTAFAGKSVRVRFRLDADDLVSTPAYQGWYVDNIRIQAGAAFNVFATVPGDTRQLVVGGKGDGVWAYRVTPLFDNCSANPFVGAPSNIEQVEVRVATAPPTAAFTWGPNPSDTNQSVAFDAGASTDRDSVGSLPGISEYRWSFGDGATASSTTATTSHAYASPGTYRVLLTVTDDDGESSFAESLHTVREPNASVSAGGFVPSSGSKSNFSVDVTQVANVPDGAVTWNDHASRTKIQSTRITRVERNGHRATIYGEGSVNKAQSTPFVMELVDNGDQGDTITITAGSYTASGTVAGGGITVRE